MNEKKVLRKNKDMVSRVVDDELILVPLYKSDDEINCIYTLNKVAMKIWECIDDKSTVGQIKERLSERFDVDKKKLNKDLKEFIKDLKEIKAIE